ncbi:MAG TPA: PAS domain-containing protein [Cytophagaceae bacterium]|nr:PAS domain-containing protein [Cytophagaceae bacterium]
MESIIHYKDIERNLVHIFLDSIITDTQYRITDVSSSISELLSYEKNELINKHVSVIFSEYNLDFPSLLNRGYFVHTEFALKDKSGKRVDVFLSGYFLGLISDINGKIVIIVKARNNALEEKKKLDKRIRELNELIYRSAHDIRGPLATIKGLVMAAKCEENNPADIMKYLDLIENVSERLDLVLEYLRESIKRKEYEFCYINIEEFIAELSDRINKLSKIYDLDIHYSPVQEVKGFLFYSNPFLSSILVENLILIINSLKEEQKQKYTIELFLYDGYVQIKIQTDYLTEVVKEYINKGLSFQPGNVAGQNGYHYLNFRIIRICSEIIESTISIDYTSSVALILTIPCRITK